MDVHAAAEIVMHMENEDRLRKLARLQQRRIRELEARFADCQCDLEEIRREVDQADAQYEGSF